VAAIRAAGKSRVREALNNLLLVLVVMIALRSSLTPS
jgi:hypothetical protein